MQDSGRATYMPPTNHPGNGAQTRTSSHPILLARQATTSIIRSPPPLLLRHSTHSHYLAHSASHTRKHNMWSLGRARLVQVVATALAVVACMSAPSSAQGTTGGAGTVPSCASKLVPCGGYLNTTTTPPASCCGPLKEAAANETACMCSILVNKAALRAFGVAPEQGLLLAKRCGVTTDASDCAKSTDGAGAATAGSTAASSASTGTAASTVAKPTASGAAAHHLSLIGASSLVGFSFIWWTIVA